MDPEGEFSGKLEKLLFHPPKLSSEFEPFISGNSELNSFFRWMKNVKI